MNGSLLSSLAHMSSVPAAIIWAAVSLLPAIAGRCKSDMLNDTHLQHEAPKVSLDCLEIQANLKMGTMSMRIVDGNLSTINSSARKMLQTPKRETIVA